MAITLYAYPDSLTAARSNIVFDVVSDSTDITTRVVAELWYRRNLDEFFVRASRKSQSKRTGYNYFRFNFSGVIQSLLSSNYRSGSTGLYTMAENTAIQYYVRFTEYYPIPDPTPGTPVNSGVFYANNVGILPTETQGTFTGSDWYMDGVASHKFLTNSPSVVNIRASERITLGFLTSYNDPAVKLKEYKLNGSSAITSYTVDSGTDYEHYGWQWTVDEDEVVTTVTPATPLSDSPYIEALSGTSFKKYMPDSDNTMFGGIRLVANNDVVDIVLPVVLSSSSFTTQIRRIAKTTSVNFETYYFYSGVWNLSSGSPYTATTSFGDSSESIPANSTKIRIKKITATGELWIPWIKIKWEDNNIVFKRGQFTMDTTHVDSDTDKFEVYVEDGSSNVISEVKTFKVDTSLVEYTARFAFLNFRGEYDHFTFKNGYQEGLDVEKIRFIKELPIGFSTSDKYTDVAFVNSDVVYTSATDYEENATLTWLKELIESKEVYLVQNDTRYAVDILSSSVTHSHHNEPLQFIINWKFSATRNL